MTEKRYIYNNETKLPGIVVGGQTYSTMDLALTAIAKIHREKMKGQRDCFLSDSEERHVHSQKQQRKMMKVRRRH